MNADKSIFVTQLNAILCIGHSAECRLIIVFGIRWMQKLMCWAPSFMQIIWAGHFDECNKNNYDMVHSIEYSLCIGHSSKLC